MELPIFALVGGGFLAEFFIAWGVFAILAAVGVIIAAGATLVIYFHSLAEAARTSRAWLAHLIFSPLLGTAVGYLFVAASWNSGWNQHKPDQASPLFILAVLVALYGTFLAPFISPFLLMFDPSGVELGRSRDGTVRRAAGGAGAAWLLSYISFATLGFAWGVIALGFAHHDAHF